MSILILISFPEILLTQLVWSEIGMLHRRSLRRLLKVTLLRPRRERSSRFVRRSCFSLRRALFQSVCQLVGTGIVAH